MNYRNKFEEYKKGALSSAETQEIENDIEKFTVLMEYFDEKLVTEPITILPSATDDFSLSEQIDKFINKQIKKSTIVILAVGILFVIFFLFGVSGTGILSSMGVADGAIHFFNGIFSAAYYFVNFWLLYRAFTTKSLKPAVFLIAWNIILIALTFILSISLGDAVPFALPLIIGFSTLPQYFADIFDSDIIYNILDIIGIAIIPANIVLAVITIVFSRKSKTVKTISKKKARALMAVFFAASVALSGVSTAVNYYNGAFPSDYLGYTIALNTIYELDDTFLKSNPLDKSDDELKNILNELGYEYYSQYDAYRKGRSDNLNASFYFGENNNESTRSLTIHFSYNCIIPTIRQDKLTSISMGEYFNIGDDEAYVMRELCSFGLFPCSVNYIETNGERLTNSSVRVSVEESKGYPNGYNDFFEFMFENGKLTYFDSFAIDD